MTDSIVTPEPNDADLARIEGDAVIAHWSGDAIAIGNASQIDILNAGRRGLFNAGFAAGRVLPSVEELESVLNEVLYDGSGGSIGGDPTNWKPYVNEVARAVLVYLTTKDEN